MATLTTDIHAAERGNGLGGRIAAAIGRKLEAYMEIKSRRDEIEALEAKSDAELARMGLRRADIPFHVFRDMFYA